MNKRNEKIGKFWSAVSKQSESNDLKLRWWQSPLIIRHVNKLVEGEYSDGLSQGLVNKIKKNYGHLIPFKKGISVGCGNGQKEINLIKQGIVEEFDLFELSQTRVNQGNALIKKNSLANQMRYIKGNAFEIITKPEQYDIVHWNNSLHHMLNVFDSVKWSRDILKKGGLFYMDDFIGSSRFQWSDKQLEIASRVRNVFCESKYVRDPDKNSSSGELNINLSRPDIEAMISGDPSEAADSERIIDAVGRYFHDVKIIKTGGVIYHLALSDMINNFDEVEDRLILDLLMLVDELCIDLNETHYATAIAIKN
ncbi:MAG: class I SAM-dependent methyltransferase [Parcubacteria group bacterium]|jgi:SAM-dependent methyltransferase